MALRDKIVMRLDGTAPTKERVLHVEATSPGGEVTLENSPGGGFVVISEKTRKGKVKNWKQANSDHVVSIEFIAGK